MEWFAKNKWWVIAAIIAVGVYAEVKYKTLTKWKDKLTGKPAQ